MGSLSLAWTERLARLRDRAVALQRDAAVPAQLPLESAEREFARLRAATRPLLEATAAAFEPLTPAGYPRIEDNGIPGPGGSLGLRFSVWHAFHVAFEHAKKPRSDEPKPTGLAGALDIRVKRMPGDPLPPRDPQERFELSIQALRWDADRGWVEVRRVLPERWTTEMLAEQLEAYLAGFAYDVAAGLPAR
ncbi:MAG TPA: hypothetical protein VFN74_23145 [Chloroflexota bacterium]|nr:hypothetical protein [Chloroflexota bacterium]